MVIMGGGVISSSPENESKLKVSTDYQVLLDMLVNFPLRYNVLPEEVYRFITSTNWIQCVSEKTGFRLANTIDTGSGLIFATYYTNNLDSIDYALLKSVTTMKYLFTSNNIKSYNNIISNKTMYNEIKNILNTSNETKSTTGSISITNRNIEAALSVFNEKLINFDDRVNPRMSQLVYFPAVDCELLDPKHYDYFMIPDTDFNYSIKKFPFTVTKGTTNERVAVSNHIFDGAGVTYDVLIYKDKLVYISSGKLNDTCKFKVFELPSLQVLETGTDKKLEIYKRLKLTRKDIIGPNAYKPINHKSIDNQKCTVQYGFRVFNGRLFDIFMNSVRVAENKPLRYKTYTYDDADYGIKGTVFNVYY